jgi:hypothetical protein
LDSLEFYAALKRRSSTVLLASVEAFRIEARESFEVRDERKSKSNSNSNRNVKGSGQECPLHTSSAAKQVPQRLRPLLNQRL